MSFSSGLAIGNDRSLSCIDPRTSDKDAVGIDKHRPLYQTKFARCAGKHPHARINRQRIIGVQALCIFGTHKEQLAKLDMTRRKGDNGFAGRVLGSSLKDSRNFGALGRFFYYSDFLAV